MVILQGRQLSLPSPSLSSRPDYSPPPHINSFLYDPNSLSLALHHSDTSFCLYPSLPLLSISSLPSPLTLIPPPTSSATFLHLHHHHPERDPNTIFLVSSPSLGGTAVLLRFYIFNPARKAFDKLKVVCNHRDMRFDENKCGVVFGVSHGVAVKLVGGINVFAMYSASSSKIWVFAVRMLKEFEEVKLMKCAVIDCFLPVFSMNVSFGYLISGEENGIRVFPLRQLVKGSTKKDRRLNLRRNLNGGLEKDTTNPEAKKVNNLASDLVEGINGISIGVYSNSGKRENMGAEGLLNVVSNGHLEGKNEKHSDSVTLRTAKLRQDAIEGGAHFIAFNSKETKSLKSIKTARKPVKAIAIRAMSPIKYLILNSAGDVYLLHLPSYIHGSEFAYNMEPLNQSMNVRKLAVFPGEQTVWMSDGQHTVHMLMVANTESSSSNPDGKEREQLPNQTSVIQAIFSSEKIQEIMPLAGDAILILGQGNMFAYAIS